MKERNVKGKGVRRISSGLLRISVDLWWREAEDEGAEGGYVRGLGPLVS